MLEARRRRRRASSCSGHVWATTALLPSVSRPRIPDDILGAAHDRAKARANRDWAEADRLRETIEAAGWKIVDHGTDFALSPAAPLDLADGARTRYGTSRNVPSRLDEAAVGLATIVLLATDWPADLDRTLASLRATQPPGVSIVIVANDPSPEQTTALEAVERDPSAEPPIEIVWTSDRFGHGAAVNTGIRRAGSPIVILLDTSVEAAGDFVTPLVRALDVPEIAAAGGWGIVSNDLRHFEDAPAGDVDAIEGYCLAFRRADYPERGPLDERFSFYRNLDIWWSLVLRDRGEGERPRRAVALDGLPLVRHDHRGYTSLPEAERDRLSKRNFYRIIDRFGARRDLLTRPG
jgi:cysteinyl-tRNA synthetase